MGCVPVALPELIRVLDSTTFAVCMRGMAEVYIRQAHAARCYENNADVIKEA